MNLRESYRHDAQIDSRRVSSGFMCEMVTNKELISLLRRYNITPDYAIVDPNTGYDVSTGLSIVIGKQAIDFLDTLLSSSSSMSSLETEIEKRRDSLEPEAAEEISNLRYQLSTIERRVVDFLKENTYIVHIDPNTSLGIPNASIHDVYLDTKEDGPPVATLVSKRNIVDRSEDPIINWQDRIR